ncbi:hypothetical protein F2Q69_00062131 [Brassica cretica]|uniref:Uncharacterized protein n=1 Tax=Brassica cretica TaxID=69181 RepID=A0A8S9RBR1_BRACR|nr:hypothetical protein F2Q69_00062131 [Brassica cretica]
MIWGFSVSEAILCATRYPSILSIKSPSESLVEDLRRARTKSTVWLVRRQPERGSPGNVPVNQSTTVVREPSRLIVGEETHQRRGAVRRTAVKTTNQGSCLHRRLRRGHLSPVNKTLRLRSTREMKRETSREMKTEDDIVGSGQRRRENASPAPERIESQSTSSPVSGSVRTNSVK